MGYGAIIASGDDNSLLSDALMECLIEVRVEQSLDEPARFGIRVREDIAEGDVMAARAAQLKVGQIISIATQVDADVTCLVRGPITDSRAQYTLGGPGSFFEVHGSDRRIELSRTGKQHAWEGKASDAARQILQSAAFEADVQATDRQYSSGTHTLNQRSSDLDFLKTLAKESGFFLWLSYDARLQGLDPSRRSLSVTEHAHFKTSPQRESGAGGLLGSIAGLELVPSGKPSLRAGAGGDCANNVTRFEVQEDVERPSGIDIFAVDLSAVRSDKSSASDPQSALANGGRQLSSATSTVRKPCITAPGDAEDVRGRAEAALADNGWFVTAQASTTAHMLKGVLQPHDVVTVESIGKRHSIPFRVRKVTHVLTASDHYMDLELQSNSHLGD